MPYRIDYAPITEEHLRHLTRAQQALVQDLVLEQLIHQPNVKTRNRKPLRPNDLATWEFRVGSLRVYYDVFPEPMVLVSSLQSASRLVQYFASAGRSSLYEIDRA